ncbi:MAG TPA: acyl carrier protein [Anaeromyxobacteraceae bacterium]|nr:acyl carrier protein [Anaeromyxobacteraceae bacterium]
MAREILRIAQEELRLPGEPPAPDEVLAGRLDSLMLLSLVVAVEDRFRVALTDDDAAGARTLADLSRLVAARASPALLPVPEEAEEPAAREERASEAGGAPVAPLVPEPEGGA